MARIAGVDLPKNKRIEIGLTYIYGIGRSVARKICAETGVDVNTKTDVLTEDDLQKMRRYIDQNLKVEVDVALDVERDLAAQVAGKKAPPPKG
jgi:small subunit ribosomal protein S13